LFFLSFFSEIEISNQLLFVLFFFPNRAFLLRHWKLVMMLLLPLFMLGAIVDASPVAKHARVVTAETARKGTYDFIIAGGGMAGLTVAGISTPLPVATCMI